MNKENKYCGKLRDKIQSENGYTLEQHLFEDDYNEYVSDWKSKYDNWWSKLLGKRMLPYLYYMHNCMEVCKELDVVLYELVLLDGAKRGYNYQVNMDHHRGLTNKYSRRFVEYVDTLIQIEDDKHNIIYNSLPRPYKDIVDRFLDENVEWVESFKLPHTPFASTTCLEDVKLGLIFTKYITHPYKIECEVYVSKKDTPENKLKLDIDEDYLEQVIKVCRDNINNNHNKNKLIKDKQLEQELIEVYDSVNK